MADGTVNHLQHLARKCSRLDKVTLSDAWIASSAIELLLIQPQHRRDLRDLQALMVPQPHEELVRTGSVSRARAS